MRARACFQRAWKRPIFINGRRHDGPFDFERLVAALESATNAAFSADKR